MDTGRLAPRRHPAQRATSTTTSSAEGGATAGNLYIQSVFHPLELAEDNKATQDYLDLMDQYNPDGKVALLGMQGMSSWLLFAKAAAACGSDLTAECLLEQAAAAEGLDRWRAALAADARQHRARAPACLILGRRRPTASSTTRRPPRPPTATGSSTATRRTSSS